MRVETDPGRWQTAYDFPALREGRVAKEDLPYGLPKGMQGLVFNTRRPIFADIRVREAILQLFDFEWVNHNYFFDLYKRTASYFDGCDLSAHGVPANSRERKLLAPFPDAVRADIMDGTWSPPVTDGSGRDRTTCAKPSRSSKAPGTNSRARNSSMLPAAGRCHSRYSPQRATKSVLRLLLSETSNAPASKRGCARSMPRNLNDAASASTST